MPLRFFSPAFEHQGVIPATYASDRDNFSPPLAWDEVPAETKSFAVLMDAPSNSEPKNHWILFNVHGSIRELPERIPPQDTLPQWTHEGISVRQGTNDFARIGYTGPLPSTKPPHENLFTLYALDSQLHTAPGCSRADLLADMHDHILEFAELIGVYTA